MKTRITVLALLVAGAIVCLHLWKGDEGEIHALPPSTMTADSPLAVESVALAVERRTSPSARVEESLEDRIRDSSRVTPSERAVLSMYDEVARVFERSDAGCREMGIAVENLTKEHAKELAGLHKERAALSVEAWSEAQERLLYVEAERMERVRVAVEQAVAHCKTNDRLLGALRDLARVGAGG